MVIIYSPNNYFIVEITLYLLQVKLNCTNWWREELTNWQPTKLSPKHLGWPDPHDLGILSFLGQWEAKLPHT